MLYFPNFMIWPTIERKRAKSKKNDKVIMQSLQTCDHFAYVMFFFGSLISMGKFQTPRAFRRYQDRMIRSLDEEVMKEGVKDAKNMKF